VAALLETLPLVEQRCSFIHCFNVEKKERGKEMNRIKRKEERG
jgi:hypothetical protein